MDSRRDFLKKAALIAGGGAAGFPEIVRRALAVEPPPGSTFLDAEHVVILMQENRSFDHCYGTLAGVRGFNDPRAVTLPDGNPVWLQTNAAGETYAPFRLNIRETNVTWMSCLPHGWADQTDARNGGRHDRWLDAKASGIAQYAHMPLTMGYYTREDIPFYYSLADAFTVCDQNFCSTLTGTTPNRLHLWTGTCRPEPSPDSMAHVRNEDADPGTLVSWRTFPEILEEQGISWRVYQNELYIPTGLRGEAESWLSNFGDNPLEYFTQYHVRHAPRHRQWLQTVEKRLEEELRALEQEPVPWSDEVAQKAENLTQRLDGVRREIAEYAPEKFAALPPREQALHRKAFTTNEGDPAFRELEPLEYDDRGTPRKMNVPKGDVLHQFRQDVRNGKLPTVSWIVAPENFSDHPSAPWYGAWYLAEVMDILTSNPDVWRKTIFILCYDENDGYFDHVPPFVPPPPGSEEGGKVSGGIDPALEYVSAAQEEEYKKRRPNAETRTGPMGLGYRVPLVIASPWSRGGKVCSQVFDHTSILQFLEVFLSHRTGRPVRESNITAWRRAVCGDLTAAFQPADAGRSVPLERVHRERFLGSIHQARFREPPSGFRALAAEEVAAVRANPHRSPLLPRQEPGVRPSCPLPYELSVTGALTENRRQFRVVFRAGRERFRDRAAGAPFHVYAPGKARIPGTNPVIYDNGRTWAFAVVAGDEIDGVWDLDDFEGDLYHLRIHGPNGFFREFAGTARDPGVSVEILPAEADGRLTGDVLVLLSGTGGGPWKVRIEDVSYGSAAQTVEVSDAMANVIVPAASVKGWYDLRVTVEGASRYFQRFAGRIENGEESITDPLLATPV